MPQAILNSYLMGATVCSMIDTTSMTMWYKGYEGVLLGGVPASDGGAVDTVENQISTTDAVQATALNQPTWHDNEVNGKGIVRFDGVNDFLTVANGVDTDLTHPLTFFLVVKVPAFTDFTMLINKGASGGAQRYSIYLQPEPTFPGRITYCGSACRETGELMPAGDWLRIIVRVDTGTSNVRFYHDGTLIETTSIPGQSVNTVPVRIGTRVDGFFNSFDLLEMGVFNRNLSDVEITDLDTYLSCVSGT